MESMVLQGLVNASLEIQLYYLSGSLPKEGLDLLLAHYQLLQNRFKGGLTRSGARSCEDSIRKYDAISKSLEFRFNTLVLLKSKKSDINLLVCLCLTSISFMYARAIAATDISCIYVRFIEHGTMPSGRGLRIVGIPSSILNIRNVEVCMQRQLENPLQPTSENT